MFATCKNLKKGKIKIRNAIKEVKYDTYIDINHLILTNIYPAGHDKDWRKISLLIHDFRHLIWTLFLSQREGTSKLKENDIKLTIKKKLEQ